MMDLSLFFTAEHSIFHVYKQNNEWTMDEYAYDYEFYSIAMDEKTNRLYIGTFEHGLFYSDNFGKNLHPVGIGIPHQRIMSLRVSEPVEDKDYQTIWAGTEPSGLFSSEDGGLTWQNYPSLLNLPSKETWSFPPRPYTHHVRSIQPDIHHQNRIFVGIELGGVMRSLDNGETFEDRKENSQHDCHTLAMHPLVSERIYEAAGGGFAQSMDGGDSWETDNAGLDPYTYLVSVAADRKDPDTIIASAAQNARTAYVPERAHTILVRKEKGEEWKVLTNDLPDPNGSSAFLLQADDKRDHTFYAVNNIGLFMSESKGDHWKKIPVEWPSFLRQMRIRSFTMARISK